MHNFRLTIQYDGGRYRGWQRLGNGENTIQAKIEAVLSAMTGESIEIIGCSRTDAGVHALAQVANCRLDGSRSAAEIWQYLNQYLPQDISISNVELVDERFHARYNAKAKTYLYRIWNRPESNPFLRKYSMHVAQPLDIRQMRAAAAHFLGEHDFTAFSNVKSKTKSMRRAIHSLEIVEQDGMIEIRARGNGFLYNMVRSIVGTLIAVGQGELAAADIPGIIEAGERYRTGRLAEAGGLFLEQIEY